MDIIAAGSNIAHKGPDVMQTEGCGINHHSWARIPLFPQFITILSFGEMVDQNLQAQPVIGCKS